MKPKFDEVVYTDFFSNVSVHHVYSSDSRKIKVIVTLPVRIVVEKLAIYMKNARLIVFDYGNEEGLDVLSQDYHFIKNYFNGYSFDVKGHVLILSKGVNGKRDDADKTNRKGSGNSPSVRV